MKKFLFLAGLCLTIVTNVVAQDFGQGGRQGGQRNMRRQIDAVVDTAIINHMDLSQEVLNQVYKLQEAKQAEQKEAMGQMRRGQRMSEEERKAFHERQQAFTTQYRKELRAIIGDEAYITYLEKMLDRRTMGFGGMQRGGMQRGQMGGGQGFGGGQGGFGGNGGFDNGGGFPGGF